jgi:hypothetical protein
MVKLAELVKYIEKTKGVKLFDIQVKFLDNLIQGKLTRVPRNFGKSMLINGYAEYLNHVLDDYTEGYEYDDYISGEDVMKTNLLNRRIIEEAVQNAEENFQKEKHKFETEYCIDWNNFTKKINN